MFDEERALLTQKKAELLNSAAAIDEALAALDRVGSNGAPKKIGAPGTPAVRAGRRPMSAAAREAARKRMKAYWRAKRKEAKG